MKQRRIAIKGIPAMAAAVLLVFMIFTGAMITSCGNTTQGIQLITTTAPRVAITELPGYGFKLVWEQDVGVAEYQVWRKATQGDHDPQNLGSSAGSATTPIYHRAHMEIGNWVFYDVVDFDQDGNPTLAEGVEYEYTVLAIPIMGVSGETQDTARWTKKVRPRSIVEKISDEGFTARVTLDPIEREFVITVTPPDNPLPVPRSYTAAGIYIDLFKTSENGKKWSSGNTGPYFMPWTGFDRADTLTKRVPWNATGFGAWDELFTEGEGAEDTYFVRAGYRVDNGSTFVNEYFGNKRGNREVKVDSADIEYKWLFGSHHKSEAVIVGGTGSTTGDAKALPILPNNRGSKIENYYVLIDMSGVEPIDDVAYTVERRKTEAGSRWAEITVERRIGSVFTALGRDDMSNEYGAFPVVDIFDRSLPVEKDEYEYRIFARKGSSADWRPIITGGVSLLGNNPNSGYECGFVGVDFDFEARIEVALASRDEPKAADPDDEDDVGLPNGRITYSIAPNFVAVGGGDFYQGWLRGNERIEIYWFVGEDPNIEYNQGQLDLIELLAGEPQITFDAAEIEQRVGEDPVTKYFEVTGPAHFDTSEPPKPLYEGDTADRLFLIAFYIDDQGKKINLGTIAGAGGPGTGTDVLADSAEHDPLLKQAGGAGGYLSYIILELESYKKVPYRFLKMKE